MYTSQYVVRFPLLCSCVQVEKRHFARTNALEAGRKDDDGVLLDLVVVRLF